MRFPARSAPLLGVMLVSGCFAGTHAAAECDQPPLDAPRAAIRRATVVDSTLTERGLAGLVVWVGGRVIDGPAPNAAQVEVIATRDTLRFETTSQGVASPVLHHAGAVTLRVRRLGYIPSRDTFTLRSGYLDTVGVGLRQAQFCLDRVRVD